MTSQDAVNFEVIIAKDSDFLGLQFCQVSDNQIIVEHVDSLIKILSIYPDDIKSIEEGDEVFAVNFLSLSDVNPSSVFMSLTTEIAKSQKLVKLKMARNLPRRNLHKSPAASPFILNITNMEGEIVRLEVHSHDDIRQVLMDFIEKNKFPPELLPSLMNKVADEFSREDEEPVTTSERMSLDELKFNRLRESPISGLGFERAIRFKNNELQDNFGKQSQNQSFFDRLHYYEEKKRSRIELLRQKFSDEREEQLRSSSFRSSVLNTSEPLLRSPQSSELGLQNLYNDHMLWLRTREKNLNRLKKELDQKKEVELQEAMRPVPQLFTSPGMHRESSPSKKVLHQSLFDWSSHYKLRREHSAAKIMSSIDSNAYFIPKIDNRSRRLATKRMEKMKKWISRSSTPERELSHVNQTFFEDSTPFINNPVGRYSFPSDYIAGAEDAETTKIYSPHDSGLNDASMRPTQAQEDNQQSFIIDEVIINQLRNSPRPNRNTESNQWIEFLCEKNKHLFQRKLPQIQSSISVDSRNEAIKKSGSTEAVNKRSRSLSPLTCDSRNNSNYRKFSYEVRTPTTPSVLINLNSVDLSPSHFSKPDNTNASRFEKDMDSVENVFCRLYQDRKYRSEGAEILRQKNIPKFPHSPNIGRNHSYPVESTKDEFFQRLFDYHEKQKAELEKSKEDRNIQLIEMSNILMENSKSFISIEESHQLAERLNRRLKKTEEESAQTREKIYNDIDKKAHSKFIKSTSNRKVMSRYTESLGEIFDVLKLSEEFEKQNLRNTQCVDPASEKSMLAKKKIDLLDVDSSSNCEDQASVQNLKKSSNFGDDLLIFEEQDESKTPTLVCHQAPAEIYPLLNLSEAELLSQESNNSVKNNMNLQPIGSVQPTTEFVTIHSASHHIYPSEFLEVAFTNPQLLKPKLLADNISIALNLFKKEKKTVISKQEFVDQMIRLMFEGQLTPFGYLLTPTDKRNDRKKKHSLRKSEDIEIEEHCTHQPKLKAKQMSIALTKQRYSDRFNGKQAIEDSLLSYIPINARKLDSIRQEIEDDQNLDCTFRPFLQATYNRELRKHKQRRSKSVPPPGYYELEDNDFDNSNLQGVVSMPLEEWYNL